MKKTLIRDTPTSDIVHIRLPPGLKEKFRKKCWKQMSSMNKELVAFIQNFLK